MSETEISSEVPADTHALNKFVTRVWEHPLVTDFTRQKRAEAFSAADRIAGDERGILLVPVGSSIWISGQNSDVDFMLLHSPNVSEDKINQVGTALDENQQAQDPNKPVLQYAGIHQLGDIFNFQNDMDSLALLFLTPDEYISGDHDLLKQLRLRALNQANYDEPARSHRYFANWFQSGVGQQLRNIKEWPVRYFSNPHDDHYPRYMEALQDRAAKSALPRRWMQKFHQGMTNLYPPSFEDMQAGVNASGGRIHLEENYRAQGI